MQIPVASLLIPRQGGESGLISLFLSLETIRYRDESLSLLEELAGTCKVRSLQKPL